MKTPPAMVIHTLVPALRSQEQEPYKFWASLLCIEKFSYLLLSFYRFFWCIRFLVCRRYVAKLEAHVSCSIKFMTLAPGEC